MNLDRLFSLGIWILVVFLSSPCALGFNDLKRPEFLHSSLWKGLKLRLQLSALLFSPPPFTLAAALWNFCHELIEFTGLPSWNLLFSIWSFLSSFFKVCDLSFQYFHLTYLLYALQSDQGESSLMLTFFLHENSLPNPFSKFVHSLWCTFLPDQQFKPCHWHLILCLRCLASLFIKGTINLIFMVRWSLRLPGEITKKMFPCSQLPRHPTSFRPSMQAVVCIREDDIFFLSSLSSFKSHVADGLSCYPSVTVAIHLNILVALGKNVSVSEWGWSLAFLPLTRESDVHLLPRHNLFFNFTGLQSGWEDVQSKTCL